MPGWGRGNGAVAGPPHFACLQLTFAKESPVMAGDDYCMTTLFPEEEWTY